VQFEWILANGFESAGGALFKELFRMLFRS
jgi:hypothetical protein